MEWVQLNKYCVFHESTTWLLCKQRWLIMFSHSHKSPSQIRTIIGGTLSEYWYTMYIIHCVHVCVYKHFYGVQCLCVCVSLHSLWDWFSLRWWPPTSAFDMRANTSIPIQNHKQCISNSCIHVGIKWRIEFTKDKEFLQIPHNFRIIEFTFLRCR